MGIESLTYPKIRRLADKHPIDLFNRIVVSHKIDGTNGRIIWNGEEMMVGSRKQVLKGERDNFGFKEWARGNVNTEVFEDNFANTNVVVFGEFFKNPINNRVEYGDDGRFRVFDIYINSVFLDWPAIVNVADKLGFEMVPYEYMNNPTREKLEDYIQGYQDPLAVGNNPDRKIGEGIVIRPPIELKYKSDRRVVYKFKSEKFEEVIKGAGQNKSNSNDSRFDEQDKALVDKYLTENRIINVVNKMKGGDPTFEVSMEITGDVIKNTIEDIQEEAEEDLDKRALGKYGGGRIAQKFKKLIMGGKL